MTELIVTQTPDSILATYALGDGDQLHVAVTRSGVVIDAYSADGEELLGTHVASADEWFDRLDN